ncbi:MAG: hypothetical protein KDL10_06860, partial [Kiritimatiellae bacterium]|nr:hypothetical protein [Kiritimatiellia bacterium]
MTGHTLKHHTTGRGIGLDLAAAGIETAFIGRFANRNGSGYSLLVIENALTLDPLYQNAFHIANKIPRAEMYPGG